MRNTTINISIAAVVNHVIDCVANVGSAVRADLLRLMRERVGYWLELGQPGIALASAGGSYAATHSKPGHKPGFHRHGPQGLFGSVALAFCTSPSRLACVRATRRG